MLITNMQALECVTLFASMLKKEGVVANIYNICQVDLKDFSLQGKKKHLLDKFYCGICLNEIVLTLLLFCVLFWPWFMQIYLWDVLMLKTSLRTTR